MFKLSRRTAVAAATCLFALSGVVSAAELTGTLKKVQETGSITLGYRESSVPFSYLNADGKPVGYAFTVCQRVADAALRRAAVSRALVPATAPGGRTASRAVLAATT